MWAACFAAAHDPGVAVVLQGWRRSLWVHFQAGMPQAGWLAAMLADRVRMGGAAGQLAVAVGLQHGMAVGRWTWGALQGS